MQNYFAISLTSNSKMNPPNCMPISPPHSVSASHGGPYLKDRVRTILVVDLIKKKKKLIQRSQSKYLKRQTD